MSKKTVQSKMTNSVAERARLLCYYAGGIASSLRTRGLGILSCIFALTAGESGYGTLVAVLVAKDSADDTDGEEWGSIGMGVSARACFQAGESRDGAALAVSKGEGGEAVRERGDASGAVRTDSVEAAELEREGTGRRADWPIPWDWDWELDWKWE